MSDCVVKASESYEKSYVKICVRSFVNFHPVLNMFICYTTSAHHKAYNGLALKFSHISIFLLT